MLVATALWALGPAFAVYAQDEDENPVRAPFAVGVMTFNIRTSAIEDGADSWQFRKSIVAETIRRSNPDIFGLQEALAEQIEYLAAELPEYRWVGVDRGLNGGTGLSEATPIFYRHDVMVPIESGTFWLGNPPNAPYRGNGGGRGGSRIVTWARFHHFETAEQIYAFNTHLSPREGQQHLDAVARIAERVAAVPADAAVLVIGDFNAAAGWSDTWRAATDAGLRDAWDVAAQRHGPAQTFGGFKPPVDEGLGRIDWILVRGPVEVTSAETVLYAVGGRYPSDHYPFVATLRVQPR